MTLERQVRDLNATLVELTTRNAHVLGPYFDAAGDALTDIRAAGLYSIGDLLPVPPALLPKAMAARLKRSHSALRFALDMVFDARMDGSWHALADELGLDETTRRYPDFTRRPRWLTIARPDIVIAGDDIAVVEPNAGSSCGVMPDADILGRLFEQAPVIGDFLRKHGAERTDAIAAAADHLRAGLAGIGLPANALVVVTELGTETCAPPADDPTYYPSEMSDPEYYHCHVFARELRRHGMHAVAAPTEDLDVDDSGVAYRGERCGAIYRFCAEQPDPAGHFPIIDPLSRAARRGRVVVADPIDDQIAGNKTVLAMLSEELDAGTLPAGVATALRGFIPWSRVLEDGRTRVDGEPVDLLPWVRKHRHELVVKPGSGYCGRGVLLGCEVDDRTWTDAIEAALKSDEAWLVQRLVASEPVPVAISRGGSILTEENFVDYGYFAVGDAVPAAVVRKNSPFGTPTRRVKMCGIGPAFFV